MAETKKLKMVFSTDANTHLNLTIPNPKEGLTLKGVREAATSMIPVLMTSKGAKAALDRAVLVTTTEEELQ